MLVLQLYSTLQFWQGCAAKQQAWQVKMMQAAVAGAYLKTEVVVFRVDVCAPTLRLA